MEIPHKSIRKTRRWIAAVLWIIAAFLLLFALPLVPLGNNAELGLIVFLVFATGTAGVVFFALASPQRGLSRAIPTRGTSQAAIPAWAIAKATRIREAAEQGCAEEQSALGHMYREGQGVPQDYAQAVFWYRKAAEQGDGPAQVSLGLLHYEGRGVTQDYAQAYFWFYLAWRRLGASLPPPGSVAEQLAELRDETATRLSPADLSCVLERAQKWFEAHEAKPQ
jgi:hypothetical protein